MKRREFLGIGLAAVLPLPAVGEPDDLVEIPNRYRMRMHWYVFGPAWEKSECRRQLELMARAHIGGVLIFPTYPIAVDDPARGIKNQRYLSDEFLETFRAVCEICRDLGLTVDIVLGTGWPYGGPSVSLADSARMIKERRFRGKPTTMPALGEGETSIAVHEVDGETREYYAVPTRMQVKRASLGAEGWVVDHYNGAALQRYLTAVGDRLLGAVPKGAVRSIFCDSFEVYHATWTAAFPEAFQAKRGYDIRKELAALFDDKLPGSRKVRYDFWRTLSELAFEQFVVPLQKWAHAHGVTTQVEAYGTPPVSISAYRAIDVPTGEHYEWKEFSSSRWASSGAHVAGKREILAEAWTWAGLPNRFADSLEQLKLCSDLHFLSGINTLYGVTYAYSPVALGAPGWVPYFGPATNHTSPYWPYFSHFADYVNRASYVLQQGAPVASIAVYLPVEDCMAEAPPDQLLLNWAVRDRLSSNGAPPEFRLRNALHYESDVVKTIITNGYAFDGIDTFVMNDTRVDSGRLRVGDGNYSALVLPNLTSIDASSVAKIADFVRSGGIVIATRRLPDDAELKKLFDNPMGKGRAIFVADEQGSFREALRAIEPDIHFAEYNEHVSFVHRRSDDRDWFFIANTSDSEQVLDATFGVRPDRVCELWDLRSGERFVMPGGRRQRFTLQGYESRVYVFLPGQSIAGRKVERTDREIYPLNAAWSLRIAGKELSLQELISWTNIPEARYFSGRGVYESSFELPQEPAADGAVMLDLGRVHETAEVIVNGQSAGVAWMRPYRIDITRLAKRGPNSLRIEVTNLLINKILGDGPIDYSAVYTKYGQRFPPGEEWTVIREPLVSGLLGPVRVVYQGPQ